MSATVTSGPRTLLDYLKVTTTFLANKGIDGAKLDAELLLAEVLGLTRTQLYTSFEQPLGQAEVDRYRELVRRRAAREPVAYITGRREFWSLDFAVDRRVLVPRPETELIVEIVVEAARALAAGRSERLVVADVGTGSGAIAVAVAKELHDLDLRVVATDRSEAALEVAPINAERHELQGRIEFRAGDGCAPLARSAPFAVIASNPPYILSGEMPGLPPEVGHWEPRRALDGGADGMDVAGPLVDDAFELLVPGGSLVVEVGTQSAAVRERFVRRGYEAVTVRRDLAGKDRVVTGRKPAS